jgi:hypothetical protein
LITHALRLTALLLLIGFSPSLVWGLSIGQRDTFEDGTTNGWTVGLNIGTGGPGGADDNFLQLTGGPASQLVALNSAQWSGNFIAAGVSSIAMDVKNLGEVGLSLRLVFSDAGGNVAFSTVPQFLPVGPGWISIVLPTTVADLTAESGSVVAALQNATRLRIYHGVDPEFPGDPVDGALGVDNITATPEPTSVVLLGSGLLALYSLKTWRGRKPRA